MPERLVFSTSFEGTLRCLGTPTPEVLRRLRALGIDPERLEPAYPVAVYSKLVDLIGEVRHGDKGPEERDFEVGRDFVAGYAQTLAGKAAFGLARVMGPKRTTQRLTRTMRGVNNYTDSGWLDLGNQEVSIWVAPVLRPHFYRGIFVASGVLIHGPHYEVTLESYEAERATFRIAWR